MKNKQLKKNLSTEVHPTFVYLVLKDGEKQKHYVNSQLEWDVIKDMCDVMNMKLIIPSGKE